MQPRAGDATDTMIDAQVHGCFRELRLVYTARYCLLHIKIMNRGQNFHQSTKTD